MPALARAILVPARPSLPADWTSGGPLRKRRRPAAARAPAADRRGRTVAGAAARAISQAQSAAEESSRMSTNPKVAPKAADADAGRPSNREKDPADWTTGDEPMTGAQASYLKTLCEEAGEAFDPGLSKAEASRRIDALQAKTGRGR
jgi:hypothetical protein